MTKLDAHLFICTSCTYQKPSGEESSPEEAVSLRRNLKSKLRESYSKHQARVSASTCLGQCESGICGVLYPKGEWLLGLRPSDEEYLLNLVHQELAQK